jgi:hypothetical protein
MNNISGNAGRWNREDQPQQKQVVTETVALPEPDLSAVIAAADELRKKAQAIYHERPIKRVGDVLSSVEVIMNSLEQ